VSLLGAKLAPLRADDLLDARGSVLLLLHLHFVYTKNARKHEGKQVRTGVKRWFLAHR
jgi:hypothetical protein